MSEPNEPTTDPAEQPDGDVRGVEEVEVADVPEPEQPDEGVVDPGDDYTEGPGE